MLVDKISKDPFTQNDLDSFIKKTEFNFLESMNKSSVFDDSSIHNINLAESMQMEDDQYNTNVNNYETVNINRNMRKSMIDFESMDLAQRKKWLLDRIMNLSIAPEIQQQIVDRLEIVFSSEEQNIIENNKKIQNLNSEIGKIQKRKSFNEIQGNKILEELGTKENELLNLQSELNKKTHKLKVIEKEKDKIEEKFMNDVLNLQTGLDQRMIQIENLGNTLNKLKEEKEMLENMIEDYKKYAENSFKKIKEVEDDKNKEIEVLEKNLKCLKEESDEQLKRNAENFGHEKATLEATIKELLSQITTLQEEIDHLRHQVNGLGSQNDISKIGAQPFNMSLMNASSNNISMNHFTNENSMMDQKYAITDNFLEELNQNDQSTIPNMTKIDEENNDDSQNKTLEKVISKETEATESSQVKQLEEKFKASLEEKEKEIKEKDKMIKEKDTQIEEKDKELAKINKKISANDERIKRLHKLNKELSEQNEKLNKQKEEIEKQNKGLLEKINLLDKELNLYKNKQVSEKDELKDFNEQKQKYESILKEKNKKIVELQSQIMKKRKSFKDLSEIKIVPGKTFTKKPSDPKIDSNPQNPSEDTQKNENISKSIVIDNNTTKDKKSKTDFNINNLPLELLDFTYPDSNNTDKKNPSDNLLDPGSKQSKDGSNSQRSQRDATKDLQKIDFGTKPKTTQSSASKQETPSKPIMRVSSNPISSYKRSNVNNKKSKFDEIGGQLKTIVEKPEIKKKTIKYSYDYLNVINQADILQEIYKTEKKYIKFMSNLNTSNWLSDKIYRLNKWKNKKIKILVMTERYIYIFTKPNDLKRKFPVNEIKSVITRGSDDNFLCFLMQSGNDEIIEYFKKNELLLMLTNKSKKLGCKINIKTNAKKFNFVTTRNETVELDPNQLKKYKPVYNATFSKASEKQRLINLFIYKKKFMGLSESFQEKVALVTDLGLIIFSKIDWNLDSFIPFTGGKLKTKKNNTVMCLFILSDKTEIKIKFHSETESKRYLKVLNDFMKMAN